jgi:hypothetical protein
MAEREGTEVFLGDARYAMRVLARNRSFAMAALLSLGLGIGLNSAVFSFTDAVLFRPFPYRDPGRLAFIWGTKSIDVRRGLNGQNVENWRTQSRTFADIAVFQMSPFSFALGDRRSDSVQGAMIGTRALPLLGTPPLLGRIFSETDEEPGGERRAVLSYGFWQSYFGGNADVVGNTIRLNNNLYSIVGVMPKDFFFSRPD